MTEEFGPDGAAALDFYLAPHSDDVCFSIGQLAHSRGAGMLCTVFTVTAYQAGRRQLVADDIRATTRIRIAEDASFAQRCGLVPQWLSFPDAFARGQPPFDAAPAGEVARQIAEVVMRAILAPTIGRVTHPRPWLFCPAGIGGHVDHLAVTTVVMDNIDRLSPLYRIAFYEDLHYASKADVRASGVTRLKELAGDRSLARRVIALADEAAQLSKMELVRLYPSQLTARIDSIEAYSPAVAPPAMPHEAVWVLQDDMHHLPG
ncbi:PIG-L family deacetylase [Caenimonas koreensis]|uniref:PIG-L family deacetylase n=1 Tax=Caenimonas koreensis TaxID=367474 RepID=UPI002B271980|nr:PIG-L family deacetylase [Caenimonas koreensis]